MMQRIFMAKSAHNNMARILRILSLGTVVMAVVLIGVLAINQSQSDINETKVSKLHIFYLFFRSFEFELQNS